jgi:hypothetical protein
MAENNSTAVASRLHVIGVRHHSPACARLVEGTIRALSPVAVLIEGPSDLNGRLGELLLGHELPIALYSFRQELDEAGQQRTRKSSWFPLCGFSPEWIALQVGAEVGSDLRFMDLPAWHDAFDNVENLTADRTDRYGDAIELLCGRTSTNNMDSLWDHLFEGLTDLEELARALDVYFDEIRELSPLSVRDAAREQHMRTHIAAALERHPAGNIVVVCGGFHAPALREPAVLNSGMTDAGVADAGVASSAETYVVPYSYHRLDAFTGYQSGMPSPAYYEALYALGPEEAGTHMLSAVANRLRSINQIVSTADLIAAQTMALALARLRSHQHPLRSDLLDALSAALLKDSREQPYPWDLRATLDPRTHPLLTEMVAVFSGDRRGRLSTMTPLPPLVEDVQEQLAQSALTITVATVPVLLDLTKQRDLLASATLHRLRVLGVPGFDVLSTGFSIDERWTVVDDLDATAHLIEASAFGPTLQQAASSALREKLAQVEPSTGPLIAVLTDAVVCRLPGLDTEAIAAAREAIGVDTSLTSVGSTMTALAELLNADELFRRSSGTTLEVQSSASISLEPISLEPALNELVAAGIDRFLWLLEQLSGAGSSADRSNVEAMNSLCAAVRLLGVDRERIAGVLGRKSTDATAPPAIRGAALGALWSLDVLDASASLAALQGFRLVNATEGPGDFLLGLFATARMLVVQDDLLLQELDAFVQRLTPDEFLSLVPSLRAAFEWFTPRERAEIGRHIARLRGLDPNTNMAGRLPEDPLEVAAAIAFEAGVLRVLHTYGLAPAS